MALVDLDKLTQELHHSSNLSLRTVCLTILPGWSAAQDVYVCSVLDLTGLPWTEHYSCVPGRSPR